MPRLTRAVFAANSSLLPAALLLAATFVWFAIRAVHGVEFATFSDESGHFLGARAIHAGDRLYRDFIDAHGPLVFMLAHLFGSVFGWKEPLDARWAIACIAACAAAAIAFSPIFRTMQARAWAAALFLGLVTAPWLVQALNMVNYHVLGGALSTVVLAWLVVPAWLGAEMRAGQASVAGLCLSLLCADAYSLAPSAVLFCAGAVLFVAFDTQRASRRQVLIALAGGVAAGFLIVLAWMIAFGDIVGWLVFHIISNQVNYARYGSFGWAVALRSLVPSAAPYAIVQSGASLACLLGLALLLLQGASVKGRVLSRSLAVACVFLGLLMLNFRGGFGFQDGSFVVAAAATFALALPRAAERWCHPRSVRAAWAATAVFAALLTGAEVASRAAVSSPGNLTRRQLVAWPHMKLATYAPLPAGRRLREVLHPGERILVLVYNPEFFLLGGFLPIHKFHEYLPWEADYARDPWFGRDRDLCAEVAARPPPAVVYDGWTVWDRYPARSFMGCIPAMLAKDYVADAIPTLFIRKDRLPAGSAKPNPGAG